MEFLISAIICHRDSKVVSRKPVAVLSLDSDTTWIYVFPNPNWGDMKKTPGHATPQHKTTTNTHTHKIIMKKFFLGWIALHCCVWFFLSTLLDSMFFIQFHLCVGCVWCWSSKMKSDESFNKLSNISWIGTFCSRRKWLFKN